MKSNVVRSLATSTTSDDHKSSLDEEILSCLAKKKSQAGESWDSNHTTLVNS